MKTSRVRIPSIIKVVVSSNMVKPPAPEALELLWRKIGDTLQRFPWLGFDRATLLLQFVENSTTLGGISTGPNGILVEMDCYGIEIPFDSYQSLAQNLGQSVHEYFLGASIWCKVSSPMNSMLGIWVKEKRAR